MRVSTRVEYGVIALADIAMNSEKGESVSTLEDFLQHCRERMSSGWDMYVI